MVCAGGYWFWFFIRVDVAAEGSSPFRMVRADLFVVSLTLSVTLGVIWALVQYTGSAGWASVFLTLYLLATTVLFGRSEEHTSEPQSLMRISYAVFCLKKKKKLHNTDNDNI